MKTKYIYPKEIWIPAQTLSSRVKNKNFRPFFGEDSLMHILVQKLTDDFPKSSIILSTDQVIFVKKIFKNFKNVLIVKRPGNLLGNSIREKELLSHFSSVIKKNYNDTVMIAQCTDPFFKNHLKMFKKYLFLNKKRKREISMFASYPIKKQAFIDNQIINGGMGDWHSITQKLKVLDINRWSCFISLKKTFVNYGYQIPPNSVPFRDSSVLLDIDNLKDFNEASKYYKKNS